MAYYFDLRFCPFWDRCGPVGARLGPFSTGFGPVSDRLRFQLLGHEIRTAFCIVFTLVFDVGDSHEKSAFRDHPRRRARSARTTSTISATSFNASHQLSNGTPLCVSTRASPRLYQQPRRATSSRRRRYHLSDHSWSYCERVAGLQSTEHSIEGLRPRRCLNPDCSAMFSVCRGCDRGQRYCSEPCRKLIRKRQLAAAARRYQASAPGKLAHCRRQKTYRQRHAQADVTHQGPDPIISPPPSQALRLTQCAVCGLVNLWLNPFYWVPVRRHRPLRRRQSAAVQISTSLDDR